MSNCPRRRGSVEEHAISFSDVASTPEYSNITLHLILQGMRENITQIASPAVATSSSTWNPIPTTPPAREFEGYLDEEILELEYFPRPISISRLPFGEVRISVASREFVREAHGKPLIIAVDEEELEQ